MPEALRTLPGQLLQLLTDPTSNPSAAFILYAIIGLVVLILLIVAIMYLMMTPEEDEELTGESAGAEGGVQSEKPATKEKAPRQPRAPRVWTPRSIALSAAIVVGLTVGIWVLAGFTTSASPVCEGCHVDTVHSDAVEGEDPHATRGCVSCHESGGRWGRYVSGVPSRLVHFVDGAREASSQVEYGRVTPSACLSCHKTDIAVATLNEERGLRMSHIEPLEAAAGCLDCHAPIGGVISAYNGGMNPCLRCHDSKTASSDCATCHDKKVAAAARARSTSFASVQIPEVKCGGCHDEAKECDTCHGTRMPHSQQFMASAHARAGAVNFWYQGGEACARCHTAERRPCTKCHTSLLGKGHLTNLATEHQSANSPACNRCHQRFAPTPSRDFCIDVCHTPIAIEGSPR